jgi:hypothetical protein
MDPEILAARKYGEKSRRKEWSRHLELINSPLPDLPETIEMIKSIKNPAVSACVAVIYLTGSRVSEVLKYKHYKTKREEPGIQRKDIYVDESMGELDYGEFMGPKAIIIRTRVLKIPESRLKKHPNMRWKKTFIDCQNKHYLELIKLIDEHITSMDNRSPEAELFTFCYQYLTKVLSNTLGWNPHFIRHLRASHLVKYHEFLDTDLRDFFGWVSGEMPSRYTHSSEERLKAKLYM